MEAKKLLSIRAFAKSIGVDETTVEQAVKQGYLGDAVSRPGGRVRIDPQMAAGEWRRLYRNTAKASPALQKYLGFDQGTMPDPIEVDQDMSIEEMILKMPRGEADRAASAYKAGLLRLEYMQKRGELVSRSDVYAAQFQFAQAARVALQSIPAKCVDAVMAAPSRHEAIIAMNKVMEEALVFLADMEGDDFKLKIGRES